MKDINSVPFQDASKDIWDKKYRLMDNNNVPVDTDINATYDRVAKSLSDIETSDNADWFKSFKWAMENGAIPAGRIMSNAGASEYKPATSTINCTVSASIEDSMDGILTAVHQAGLTLKAGCGIGYEFSTLRPSGAFVAGAGSNTSGPISFMDIFDKMCLTISSAGGRRGAQMATFDIHHPDILEFIKAKREDGRLRQFNLSCLITSDFMEAVKKDYDWDLSFPLSNNDLVDGEVPDDIKTVYRDFPIKDKAYTVRDDGMVLCRIYKTMKARRVMDVIMASTYDFAEPGFILIDEYNKMNNNWWVENIRATNPCGEQGLPENGACLLGSINLTKFVTDPFTVKAKFDFVKYVKVINIFTRMLDNVVEINGLPLEAQRKEIEFKRRHGMGFLGLGSTLTMLGIKYGSSESVELTKTITYTLAKTGFSAGLSLAKEKGAAPIMNTEYTVTSEMISRRPVMKDDGYNVGDKVLGKVLWAKYSHYMNKFIESGDRDLIDELIEHGCRFTHHSSIAPTGTISLSLGNNVSNGIEPSFAHHYSRNIIKEGRKTKENVNVFSFELLAYRHLVSEDAMPDTGDKKGNLPVYFTSADEVTPIEHIDIQAASQYWIDSSISKTANVPTDIDYDEFKGIYMYAYEKGLKGCTTFRYNPEAFSGVLVRNEDLKNTEYNFTLEDGSTVTLKGSDEVEYDGETHTAANLFDALKEGYYGKL